MNSCSPSQIGTWFKFMTMRGCSALLCSARLSSARLSGWPSCRCSPAFVSPPHPLSDAPQAFACTHTHTPMHIGPHSSAHLNARPPHVPHLAVPMYGHNMGAAHPKRCSQKSPMHSPAGSHGDDPSPQWAQSGSRLPTSRRRALSVSKHD